MRMPTLGTACATLFTASLLGLGYGVADAAEVSSPSSASGLVNVEANLPLNVCGNAIGVVGNASAYCLGGASTRSGGAGSDDGLVDATANVPVNVCGNAAGVLGDARASCKGGASTRDDGDDGDGRDGDDGDKRSDSLVNADANVPVNICGNALGNASARCKGGAKVKPEPSGSARTGSGKDGLVDATANVPVNICGNAAGVLGDARARCKGGAKVGGPGRSPRPEPGDGSQEAIPVGARVNAPINVCGNAVGVVGDARASCQEGEELPPTPPPGDGDQPPQDGDDNGNGGKADDELPVTGGTIGLLFALAGASIGGGLALRFLPGIRFGRHAA